MGSNICCSQKENNGSRIKARQIKKKNSDLKPEYQLPESSSTLDSDTQIPFRNLKQEVPVVQKSYNFKNYIRQREFEISSIKKFSQSCGDCSQQKMIISYLQKIQKQMEEIKRQNDPKLYSIFMDRDQKYKLDEKRFIQHSCKCPICFELLQNLKSIEHQEMPKFQIQTEQNRISLQGSLLQSQQCQKAKRCEECKCQVLSSYQWAQKAMRKYPNTNTYQCRRLKFRKTSLFEPQIKQARESEEGVDI